MATRQRRRTLKGGPENPRPGAASPPTAPRTVSGSGVFLVPLALTAVLFLFSFVPRVQGNDVLRWSFWGAVALLLVWQAAIFLRTKAQGVGRALVLLPARAQHYIQAMCQFSVFLYWGYHWRPVYDYMPLLFAQLAFAYTFDLLLSWSRRESYSLGYGPFPIIFSINLFLWFRDDWFYLQFLMVGIGFMGKEFVRWHRADRGKTHIFNPSAFALGLFSLILIVTDTTRLTWGPEIASTLSLAPNIYLYLFAMGLVVMYFFSITLVAASTAATLFAGSAIYSAVTGVPYFLDTEIPTAVFLGLHLLVTDPSTSPRTPPGKVVFGVLYGLSVIGLYALLGALGAPTFYDKLMAVPLLNLSVRAIDRGVLAWQDRPAVKWWMAVDPRRANLAHMAAWMLFFATMTVLGRTDGRHPGDSLPFWQQACEEGRPTACKRLVALEGTYCRDNSGWACNALGRHYAEGEIVDADEEVALGYFSRACELRFQPGCANLLSPGTLTDATPRVIDLRLLLREGGKNLMDMPEGQLYGRACEHGWDFACQQLSRTS